jgi:nucleoside-diphosphate-sugar epimerase
VTRVLITGVTGFTGRYLAPTLAQAGYEVHGTAHGDSDLHIPGVHRLHSADVADAGAIAQLVSDLAPAKVVHLAAISFVGHSDVAEMYRTNILGTRNLLDSLANCAAPPEAVLIASSANIYGNARQGVLDESVPPSPVNDYAVTKAASELVSALYVSRLPLIVVRPFNYTGRGQSADFLIPKIVSHVRDGASEIRLGNVDVERDFSDVRDLVAAYARLLETPAAIGETFNFCSGTATSLRRLVDLVADISGKQISIRSDPALMRRSEVKSLCGSPARLEQAIGRLPRTPIEETLRWMLEG